MYIAYFNEKKLQVPLIPQDLQFGDGYTRDGLRCVWVQVQYGKIWPVVYLC